MHRFHIFVHLTRTSLKSTEDNVTCGQWALYRMLQRILMENQYIFEIFMVSDRYIIVFSACMRNRISKTTNVL